MTERYNLPRNNKGGSFPILTSSDLTSETLERYPNAYQLSAC